MQDDPWHHWQRGQGLMQYAFVPCFYRLIGIVALLVIGLVFATTGDFGRGILPGAIVTPLICINLPGLFFAVLWLIENISKRLPT